ncbi:hypothetical protein L6R46_20200 [Myxococcota bacterium]|nr:hypothetical protein [Myxococcota bacterium]
MNLELLRRWVRRELEPGERREVGRWMLRSTDPSLPGVLHGLVRELEEERLDAAITARSPTHAFLVGLWHSLINAGRASIATLQPPALAGGAVLGAAAAPTGFGFRDVGGEIAIDLMLSHHSGVCSVFATTDQAEEHLLLPPTDLQAGIYADVARWTPEDSEGRVTLWLVIATEETDRTSLLTLRSVEPLLAAGAVKVVAARWEGST